MSKIKAILYGLGIILAAVGGFLAASFDDDPATTGNIGQTITEVKEGVEVIKDATEKDAAVEDAVPVPAASSSDVSYLPVNVELAVASASESKKEDKEDDSTDSDGATA